MKIKLFYPESDGSIRLSKQELQALLDEVYEEGVEDGKRRNSWYGGSTITTPYYYTVGGATTISSTTYNSDTITCKVVQGTLGDCTITTGKSPYEVGATLTCSSAAIGDETTNKPQVVFG